MKSSQMFNVLELSIMLLIFSFTGALCLRAFVWAHETTSYCQSLNQAYLQAQNLAELLKLSEGNATEALALFEGTTTKDGWQFFYDSPSHTENHILVKPQAEDEIYYGTTKLQIVYQNQTIDELTIAWPKEASHEKLP